MLVFGEDEYTRELEDHGTALWRAELSDGFVVVQDDYRPGLSQHSAWFRLAQHVKDNNLRINELWLQFRSHHEQYILPANAEGYFFCKSAILQMHTTNTEHYYLLGYLEKNNVYIQRWMVPELILCNHEVRPIESCESFIIRN